ncbi:hypothetical protein E2C01_065814 [Portunus trituberculatus]|uniref:RNA-directed DNA polymerase from mobile element jockey n=1 Tax=Portunus trituberculatus TaxID=210409 RepID=A0A5B7HNK8_PORTR|nr:hypothetical protein [Portunus trituberculatus]
MYNTFFMPSTCPVSCGLIISQEKSRIFPPVTSGHCRRSPVGGTVVPHCAQYTYLGAPVRVTSSIPARQRVHPIIKDLLDRLEPRFTLIKWLATNATGVSTPVVRTLYIQFIRSVIDYLFPALAQLPRKVLEPLEKFQNRIMRFILGCPPSTRIVNMQTDLDMPPIIDRIYANITYFTVKCLHSLHLALQYSAVIKTSLNLDTRRLPLRLAGQNLVKAVCDNYCALNLHVPEEQDVPHLPPWRIPSLDVTFTPITKDAPPILQKQAALETIAIVSASIPEAHHIYVDG